MDDVKVCAHCWRPIRRMKGKWWRRWRDGFGNVKCLYSDSLLNTHTPGRETVPRAGTPGWKTGETDVLDKSSIEKFRRPR